MRGSRRSWRRTRPAVASVIRALTSPPRARGTPARGPSTRSRAEARRAFPLRRSGPSRMRRSSSQRSASSMTWLETRSVVPATASAWNVDQRSRRSTGSRPTVGSSRTRTSGPPSSARREGDTGALTARERADDLILVRSEPDRRDRLVDAVPADVEDPREVAQVLADREVAVDRRLLGDVPDPPPVGRRACGLAQHRHRAALHDLHADDRAHQRRLARAARPEEPGDHACADLDRDLGQDASTPTRDTQSLDRDGHVGAHRPGPKQIHPPRAIERARLYGTTGLDSRY